MTSIAALVNLDVEACKTMLMSWGGRERREVERCRIDIPCKLQVAGNTWTGMTRDISLRGASFKPGNQKPVPESYILKSVCFELMLPTQSLKADCEITRVVGGKIGLKFLGFQQLNGEAILIDFLESQLSKVV
ncbi:MAG: PilZ domain-containing protein [Deltaproteobacteria bacterium]|nr:PilZ domain-containing protein [Deltaproteobacteria bacterium]MBT6434757.1 PilZ domain-containing protein [Deltaproteobacteria bacterium]